MALRTNNLLGIGMMALGMFLFAAVDTIGKFLTAEFHPLQIVWFRQLGLFVGVVFLLLTRGRSILKTAHPRQQVARGAVAVGSATLFIMAVSFIPLADAAAISFVAPFFVTLMGALILREAVGMRRWVAVVVGFIGALIVIRPGLGVMHPAAFLVIAAAFLFAVRQIISRTLAADDSTVTTVAYTAIVSVLILTVTLPFVWVTPGSWPIVGLLVVFGVLAALAETCVIKALEVGEAVAVAPVHYSIMLWSTFYGWLIFSDLPDLWTWIGAAVIMATGAYTLHRERVVVRKAAPEFQFLARD